MAEQSTQTVNSRQRGATRLLPWKAFFKSTGMKNRLCSFLNQKVHRPICLPFPAKKSASALENTCNKNNVGFYSDIPIPGFK